MREGDNFPELRDRFHERIVRRGHEQAEARLRLLAERAGATGVDVEALAAVLSAPIISYRVLTTLFGRPPGDLDEDRYLDTWTASAVSLLEAHGLLERPRQGGIQVSNGDHLTRTGGRSASCSSRWACHRP